MEISALMYLSFILMVLTLAINAMAEWVLDYTGASKGHV
jgi:ABC-type phosphate transport system permease subunit